MFLKDNLGLVRAWRGLSQKDVSTLAELPQSQISKIEKGSLIPDNSKIEILASVLKVPVSLLSSSDLVTNTGVHFYRKQNKTSAKALKRIEAEALIKRLHFKLLDLEHDNFIFEIKNSISDPIEIARKIRSYWNVSPGPISDLCSLLEKNGIIICQSEFPDSIDGFFIAGDLPMIFVNRTLVTDRLLFTLAHELGHMLLHSIWNEQNEKEANVFAAELLMPEEDIKSDFAQSKINIERLAELKLVWNVSMQALLYRAGTLGFLSESQRRRLWTEMGKLGYIKREPSAFDLKIKKPSMESRLIQSKLIEEENRDISNLLFLYKEDLEALYSLDTDYQKNNRKAPVYSGNITGGGLLVKESRIVAELLLEYEDVELVRDRILSKNLFQNGSPSTTRKYLNLILPRFDNLSVSLLKFIARGDKELSSMTLFYSILKANRLLIDFIFEVIADKVQRFDRQVSRQEWLIFLDEKSTIDESIMSWSESSKKKVGQVIFRILCDAGYLTDTKNPEIVCPIIPFELVEFLQDNGEEKFLNLMELKVQND